MHSIIPSTFKKYLQKPTFLSQHGHTEICNFIEKAEWKDSHQTDDWLPVLEVGE